MAGMLKDARAMLAAITKIKAGLRDVGGLPATGGVDRPTRLDLAEILANTRETRRALKPSAVDQRSVL